MAPISTLKNKLERLDFFDFVVARYNEDASWIYRVGLHWQDRIFIYNKGQDMGWGEEHLENIGREGHTFVYHIIKNYYDLRKRTVFFQGDPLDHLKDHHIEAELGKAMIAKPPFSLLCGACCLENNRDCIQDTLAELFPINFRPARIFFGPGGMFTATDEAIHARPIKFWQHLYDMHARWNMDYPNGLPWMLERIWPIIFDPTIPHLEKFND